MKILTDNIFMYTKGTFLFSLKLKHKLSLFIMEYKCIRSAMNLTGPKTPFDGHTSNIELMKSEVFAHRND
jgi:hypothetical protein